jgi:phosphoribosylanthranilate isomerase
MFNKPLIKICGIKQPAMAYAAAQTGADFIGLMFAPGSKRLVSVAEAIDIAAATREGGATPVAVFTDHTAAQMLEICRQTKIDWVQLHGDTARNEQHLLPEDIHRIYVCSLIEGSEASTIEIPLLKHDRDYLLFDTPTPGVGEKFDWQRFSYAGSMRWFLAGGLAPDNVAEAVQLLQPHGVDVSSGVEDDSGEKNLSLIEAFIQVAQKCE